MKTTMLFSVILVVAIIPGVSNKKSQSPKQTTMIENVQIKLSFGNTTLTATLYNNPASRDFLTMLPLTTTLEDYASTEKIFYPKRKLSKEGAPAGFEPSKGDITYYAPWGNIAIFYKDFRYSSGLISLGKIDSDGIEQLQNAGEQEVTFELIAKN